MIDAATGNPVRGINVGEAPEALAVTRNGEVVYVANAGSGTVSVIDTVTRRLTATIAVGAEPMGVAFGSPAGPCAGDCNGDGVVTVAELVTGISIALGDVTAGDCTASDRDRDGEIVVDELLCAVNAGLEGCHP